MTVELQASSPLTGWAPSWPETVAAREVPFLTQLDLRTDDPAALAAVLGVEPPTTPCTWSGAGEVSVLWVCPDEWLVTAPPGAALLDPLRDALAGTGAVTDVSAQRTCLELTGPGARGLLARGCAVDLHPSVSPAGTCVQTLLARAGVIIAVDGAEAYRLFVRASFATYLASWLTDASRELAS